MQFKKPFKEAIARGQLTLTFRNWQRPQVKVGGQYNIPPHGAIEVTSLSQLPFSDVTSKQAQAAGFSSCADLQKTLGVSLSSLVWRVEFEYLGSNAVNQAPTDVLSADELAACAQKLAGYDKSYRWTQLTLQLIDQTPGTRAADLAHQVGLDVVVFKRNVRKLKALGLTESLEVGYRLTARGQQILKNVG